VNEYFYTLDTNKRIIYTAKYFLKNFLLFNSDKIEKNFKKKIIDAINDKEDTLSIYGSILKIKKLVLLLLLLLSLLY
jgi:hypothetical protein